MTPGRMELSSADLDRLEDALEDLEFAAPSADGPDEEADEVALRLGEFRSILALSREAMPMQDVPAGLLDGVLEEGRRAAAATTPAPKESWWSRLRLGTWVPTLAFAGSAALLLVVLWPVGDSAEEAAAGNSAVAESAVGPAAPAAAAEKKDADGRLADASVDRSAVDPYEAGAVRGQGMALSPADEAEPEPEEDAEAPSEEAPAEPAQEPELESKLGRSRNAKKSASKSSGYGGDAPVVGGLPGSSGKKSKGGGAAPPPPSSAPKPKPSAPSAEDKKDDKPTSSPLWSEIIEGDAQRRGGNCGFARMRYEKARKADDAKTRARALAGRGLCDASDGKAGSAAKLFEQARATDPSVGAFIERELAGLEQAPSDHPPMATEQAVMDEKE